jgi:DMSO/TMAO reductase YedYZ molybdopterin-dependent catalytic subunit
MRGDEVPDWKKLIEGKIALAQRSREQGNKPSKPSLDARVPAGQTVVTNFPILDLGILPEILQSNWTLRIYGLVENELHLSWDDFQQLPQMTDVSDFHCVTRWSKLDVEWGGVSAQQVLMMAGPKTEAKFVTLHSYDDYTTNLPLEALLDEDVIIAHSALGYPLTTAHGGPVRMVVPKRYAWKSAKWLKAIEIHEEDRPGFWEERGYHNEADPFKEQRFSD